MNLTLLTSGLQAPIEVVNSSLRRLVIDSCFADLHLYSLSFATLHTLHFSHTHMLQDHHIAQLVQYSPSVRHLSLFSCASLRHPVFSFKRLLVLNLVSCDEMTQPEVVVRVPYQLDASKHTADG